MRARAEIETDRQRPRGDRRHRDPVPGQQGAADREDRRAGQGKEARRHQRAARRVRQGRHAHLHRGQARRVGRGGAQQPLPADADGVGVRHQHGGAGRRPPAVAQPQADPRSLRPPPPRSGHPPHHLRAAQGPRPRPHPRRPDGRARQHRRDDRADQDLGQPERGARTHARPHAGSRAWSARCWPRPAPRPRVRKTCRRASA